MGVPGPLGLEEGCAGKGTGDGEGRGLIGAHFSSFLIVGPCDHTTRLRRNTYLVVAFTQNRTGGGVM